MYLRHYGFRRLPFNNTPDSRFFFRSGRHSEALAALQYTVRARKGFAVLTGEVGAGKTTVARCLFKGLESDAVTAVVTNTHLTSMQLLQVLGEEFGIATRDVGRVELLRKIEAFLTAAAQGGRDVIVLIDEAQNLSPQALEEVRMLSNIETEEEKLVQVILLGQPELNEKIDRPDLRQFRQRIAVRFHLEALDRNETFQYIVHRLQVAGPEADVRFSRSALKAIHLHSRGVPRLVNTVCDNALLLGFVRGTRKITSGIIADVVKDLEGPRARSGSAPAEARRSFRLFGRPRR